MLSIVIYHIDHFNIRILDWIAREIMKSSGQVQKLFQRSNKSQLRFQGRITVLTLQWIQSTSNRIYSDLSQIMSYFIEAYRMEIGPLSTRWPSATHLHYSDILLKILHIFPLTKFWGAYLFSAYHLSFDVILISLELP